ncbi:MAG TPA: ABC transporter ATP-binding protein [Pseudonocardiaceae bacterium]|jgi:peptide/nickel transport system ATP-binding protein|nr:ABC transporter ATP-binding protein [Pseudonocardiaceae bacterium]
MLVAERLNRSFARPRRTQAVRDASFTVAEGGRLGIVGESGSGKSTLLRLLLGLDKPDSGTVRFRDREVRAEKASALHWFRREVQVVFQDPRGSLDPRMRVREIIAEPLECLGVREDHAARIAEVLAEVDLEPDAATRYPHQFSGGQRQRIAIARALAPRPRLLVGDEPFSALDASVREKIIELVADLAVRLNLSLILVSHDIGVVHRLCDQLLVLRDGEIVEQGRSATVLRTPTHPYTRELLAAVPRLPDDIA